MKLSLSQSLINLMKVLILATVIPQTFATNFPQRNLYPRQTDSPCLPGQLIGQVGTSNGGRKIGIVIDSSGSMDDNDPTDIRLAAAKALSDSLISSSEETGGKAADLLTVVDFSSTANILYPLGDPTAASNIFGGIGNFGGTYIGGGIESAIEELSKPGNDPTPNRTGIIVLTDGIDDPTSGMNGTIEQITRAGALGIRVSFGFLSVDSLNQDPAILNAVFGTGGTYTTFNAATSLDSFVAQVLLQGLTGVDEKSGDGITLLPGLTTSSLLTQTGSSTFSYTAKVGENLNFTVTSLGHIALTATLRDKAATKNVAEKTTDASGIASIIYQTTSSIELELVVTARSAGVIFSVGLNSSILSCPNITSVSNSTPTGTVTATPVQFTGSAAVYRGFPIAIFSVLFASLLL